MVPDETRAEGMWLEGGTEAEWLEGHRRKDVPTLPVIEELQRTKAELARVVAERDRLRADFDDFVEGLSRALNEHGVPAMPSWREAIDYLAEHGSTRG